MDENKPQPNTGENLKNLRTYSSDMADAVRTNEASVIKIALAEQKKHEREDIYRKAEGTSTSKILLILGGVIFIGGGLVGAYFLLQKKEEANKPQEVIVKTIPALISYDAQAYVDMTNVVSPSDVVNALTPEIKKEGKLGSIKSIIPTAKVDATTLMLPLKNIITLLQTTAPGSLIRSLNDTFMIGTYQDKKTGGKSHLFLILETKDYNQAFSGMLQWEKTMLSDLYELFHVDVSGERQVLLDKEFKDIILNNKDARILYDAEGNDILYYLFVNKTTFIITDSQDGIKEILTRLMLKNTKPL